MAIKEHIYRHTKRLTIAIVGGVVVLFGILTIPYPGPGLLIVFAGLAILATEFKFAQGILDKVRSRYDQWKEWINRQNIFVRCMVFAVTGVVILVTAWIINTFGVMNRIFDLGQDWLISPFFR